MYKYYEPMESHGSVNLFFTMRFFVQAGPFCQCRCLLSPPWSVGKTDLPEKKIICFQKCKLLQDEWFPYHKLRIFRTTDILIDQKSGYSTLSFVLLQKKFQILGFLQSTRQINASGAPFFLSSAAANERTSDHKLQRGSLCYSRPPERKNRRERLTESCHLEDVRQRVGIWKTSDSRRFHQWRCSGVTAGRLSHTRLWVDQGTSYESRNMSFESWVNESLVKLHSV